MTMKLETIMTQSIAQLSYLIGDSSIGTACVIDPRPDCDTYLELARRHGLAITHIFETHIHADFVSGGRELMGRCGSAKLYCSEMGGASYDFDHEQVDDGDTFAFGSVSLIARHTPGHTPEHVSYLIAESDHADDPWAVASGDSLFVGSAGRPDLVHDERGEKLPDQLFDTLTDFYRQLDDHVIVFPGHGAGSACGASIGDRPVSTIGYERRHNPFLQYDDRDAFKAFVNEGAPAEPTHYARLKKLNASGPATFNGLPSCPAMTPNAFEDAIGQSDTILLDVRELLAFGGGHIPGAINIANRPDLSNWAGWLLDVERPLLLVLDRDEDVDTVQRRLMRVGLTRFAGYLAGGMPSWETAGWAAQTLPQWSVHDLHEQLDEIQVLDVRGGEEYAAGHVPGAKHIHLPELVDHLDELDRNAPIATFCGSGYRANIAASVLQREGFDRVCNVVGSWQAWQAADLPVTS